MPGSGVRVSPQLLKGSPAESNGVHIGRRFAFPHRADQSNVVRRCLLQSDSFGGIVGGIELGFDHLGVSYGV